MNLFRAIAVIVFAAISYFAARDVPLVPEVDRYFFFSANDPQLESDQDIRQMFGAGELLIVAVEGEVSTPQYQKRIAQLSSKLSSLEGVSSVESLSHGPQNYEEVVASPLWSRLLLFEDGGGSNVILMVGGASYSKIVRDVTSVSKQFETPRFRPHISGVPFIIERIGSMLYQDLKVFTCATVCILILLVLYRFRSIRMLAGIILSCSFAAALTLRMLYWLNVQIGVLTANLITVVFVLTSSHLVFLAFAASKSKSVSEVEIAKHAVRHTIHPSFWAMFTTALGFSTYLFVDAKPLREFGISGALASLSAFLAAFMVMPIFLGRDSLSTAKRSSVFWNRSIRGRVGSAIALLLIVAAVLLFSGLLKLNTDPSLLSYFGKNSDLYKGLAYVDRHGGSSPLRLVLYDSSGRSYTDSDVFERAFALQRALESRAEVGSVISLPLIMAEANRAPLSKLLTWDWLLDAVGFAGYQEVVGRFLTADRRFGLFLLRMKELDRKISRGDILKRIESLARTHGFSIYRTGGVFALQNQIGKLIYDSIVTSLLWSIPFFLLSAFVISGSLIVALAVVITVATAPLILLGFAGWLSIPLDLVSVPAATLVTAFGVDAMLHLTHTHMQRRALTSTWLEDASYLRVPILNSAAILGFGFSVLFLSNFPPSVRFGAFLVCGVIISSTATLILLPRIMLVARRQSRFFRS